MENPQKIHGMGRQRIQIPKMPSFFSRTETRKKRIFACGLESTLNDRLTIIEYINVLNSQYAYPFGNS